MIEESIKAVREAEAKAETMIAEAAKNAAEIVKAAEARAEADKAEAFAKFAEEAAEAAKAAQEAGDAKVAEAEAEAAKEAASLKAQVAPKTEAAVKAVIDKIL